MTIAEQLRALMTQMADVQRVADWETQLELARAATILVREAGRLEAEQLSAPMNERWQAAFVGRLRR